MASSNAAYRILAGFAVAALFGAPAQAGEAGCDYFQNALIGTRCAGTYSLGESTSTGILHEHFNNSVWDATWDKASTSEELSASVTLNNWLTLDYYSSFGDHSYKFTETNVSGFHNSGEHTFGQMESQNPAVGFTLFDSGAGPRRFVLNGFAGVAYTPAYYYSNHSGTFQGAAETGVYGGLKGAVAYGLGSREWSAVPSFKLELDRYSPTQDVFFAPSAGLNFANSSMALSFGPFIKAGYWLAAGPGGNVSKQSTNVDAGGDIMYQPFHGERGLWLNGLILEASASHSLGQAAYVDPATGWKANEWQASASATFHFQN